MRLTHNVSRDRSASQPVAGSNLTVDATTTRMNAMFRRPVYSFHLCLILSYLLSRVTSPEERHTEYHRLYRSRFRPGVQP